MRLRPVQLMLLMCATTMALAACGAAPTPSSPPAGAAPATAAPDSGAANGGHAHAAPHAGSLVEFGDEFAHLELVLDASTGTLTAYVLDGEAERPVRLAAAGIDLRVTAPGGVDPVRLLPVANALSGETAGDTSMYAATVPGLKGLASFSGAVVELSVKGQTFTNVDFAYPSTAH